MRPESGTASAPAWADHRSGEGVLRQAALSLGLSLADEQVRQLLQFRDLLLKWNKTYNLTAIRRPEDALKQHLIDCLSVVGPIKRHLFERGRQQDVDGVGHPRPEPQRILDVGSGGGLPGVVIAILLPHLDIDCVDAVGKKAAFIRQVALDLQLPNLKAIHARVQDLSADVERRGSGYDLIVSRAFSSLADFTHWTEHLVQPGGAWMAMKGQQPTHEQEDPTLLAHVFHVEQLSVPGLEAQRCLVWLKPQATLESPLLDV